MGVTSKRRGPRARADRDGLVLALGEQLSALLSASRALTAEASASFHPDLPPGAFHIRVWLHAYGPANVSRVAEAVAMDRSATSRLTARLIALGLIEAHPDPSDGRGVVLALTDRGHKEVSRATARKDVAFRQRIDNFGDADLGSADRGSPWNDRRRCMIFRTAEGSTFDA
jgi:DNA-binding MarR family transcriptional regulator